MCCFLSFVIGTVNDAVIVMPGIVTDQSSFDKRIRKKCAAKATSPERNMSDFVIDPFIQVLHNKHMRSNRFKHANSS
jgi:hypothetical protein